VGSKICLKARWTRGEVEEGTWGPLAWPIKDLVVVPQMVEGPSTSEWRKGSMQVSFSQVVSVAFEGGGGVSLVPRIGRTATLLRGLEGNLEILGLLGRGPGRGPSLISLGRPVGGGTIGSV